MSLPSLSPGSVLQAENRAYGHARTLSEYAGFARTRWVPGALQHGWNPFDGIGMNDGVWRRLPKFVWSEDNVERGRDLGGHGYRAIGAPWLYLLRLSATSGDVRPGNGDVRTGSTIAFPFHATVHTRMIGSHADYARDLADGRGGARSHGLPSVDRRGQRGHPEGVRGRRGDDRHARPGHQRSARTRAVPAPSAGDDRRARPAGEQPARDVHLLRRGSGAGGGCLRQRHVARGSDPLRRLRPAEAVSGDACARRRRRGPHARRGDTSSASRTCSNLPSCAG